MRSLKDSMDLAAKCNLEWLDPTKGYFPVGGFEVAHDTGRWWESMLGYESACKTRMPAKIEAAMYINIQKLMKNKLGLLLNNPDIEWQKEKAFFNSHNFREGIMALAALVKYRKSDWAAQTGHRLLETLDSFMMEDGRFDFAKMADLVKIPIRQSSEGFSFDGTTSGGRAIEAIIWFYEATEDPLALKVAGRLAEFHLENTVKQNGSIVEKIISPENIGHNHSYLGTLRGLLLYGLLTGSKKYIEAVSNTYDVSIWKNNISWAGWAPHDLGKARFNNEDGDPEADPASCGDVAQIALWLALRAGRSWLLDDVERLIRATIIPSQITNDPDPRRNGAWGIHRHPFGQGAILDVFAAVLHTLTDVYNNIVTEEVNNTIRINMNFEIKTPSVEIKVTDTDDRVIDIKVKKGTKLKIRIPGWVDVKTIKLSVNGEYKSFEIDENHYLNIENTILMNSVIELSYGLPEKETIEEMKVSHRKFTLTWRGDTVTKCIPKVPIYD